MKKFLKGFWRFSVYMVKEITGDLIFGILFRGAVSAFRAVIALMFE